MAKSASELNRKVLQNIRTTKDDATIYSGLTEITALGEIAVQMGTGSNDVEKRINTGLWTLAADGNVAVRFPSEEWVLKEITSGASIAVDNVIEAVGLQESGDNKGELPTDWNDGTEFISASTTVVDALTDLDNAISTVSGNVEQTIIKLSGDVIEYVDTASGDIQTTIFQLSGDVKSYVDAASGNIETTINQLSGDVKSYVDTLSGNVYSTFDALDKEAAAKVGQVVTTVSQVNGLVSETQDYLKNITLSGYSKTSDTGAITDADTLEKALSKLENASSVNKISNSDGSINVTTAATGTDINVNIKSGEKVLAKNGDAGLYTDIKLSSVTPSSTNVKEEYVLCGTDGSVLGDHVKIYKDSAYKEIYLGTSADTIDATTGVITKEEGDKQSLNYAYQKADGTYDLVKVDVSAFLSESEFKSGVTATNHIVHGVVDPASETDSNDNSFLTVGGAGFKVDGIKDEINAKIAALDAGLSGKSDDNRVEVRLAETDGKINNLEVLISDVASASALTELSGSVIELSGVVKDIVEGFDSEVTGKSQDNRVTVVVAQANGTLSGATVTLNDIASASALTELSGSVIGEIARAKSAETALDGVIGSVKGASDETRTYGHQGTNYLNSNDTVKEDVESLDTLLGSHTGESESDYNVTFTDQNTVADSISDIRKKLDEYKESLTLTAVDDNKYIATEVTSGDTGTTIGVSALTKTIADSTNGGTASDSALVDSWDAKQYAITDRKQNDGTNNGADSNIKTIAATNAAGKMLDFSEIVVDCGEF